MTARVWAFRAGNFTKDRSSGWSHTIHFKSLKELTEELANNSLEGQVEILAIVAHGDSNGLVQLDRNLTPGTLASFGDELDTLNKFLVTHGKLIFVSCIAGTGKEGDELLTGISKRLPNRHVIGFTIFGGMAQEGFPTLPGQILEVQHWMPGMPAKLLKGLPTLTEYSYFSKWARNGYITRIPIDEQSKDEKHRCAWSLCPGHAKATDRCQPALKGVGRPWEYP